MLKSSPHYYKIKKEKKLREKLHKYLNIFKVQRFKVSRHYWGCKIWYWMPSDDNLVILQISNNKGILWEGFLYKFHLRLILRNAWYFCCWNGARGSILEERKSISHYVVISYFLAWKRTKIFEQEFWLPCSLLQLQQGTQYLVLNKWILAEWTKDHVRRKLWSKVRT